MSGQGKDRPHGLETRAEIMNQVLFYWLGCGPAGPRVLPVMQVPPAAVKISDKEFSFFSLSLSRFFPGLCIIWCWKEK